MISVLLLCNITGRSIGYLIIFTNKNSENPNLSDDRFNS